MDECKLSNSQWGFQVRKSTTTALIATTHDWHKYLDEGAEVCAIFLDLKKAFDAVPHQHLLDNMSQIGIHPVLLRWTCKEL